MNKKSMTITILIALILNQNLAEAKINRDYALEKEIEFINDTLLSLPNAGDSLIQCNSETSRTEKLDLDTLIGEINTGLDEIIGEIQNNQYQAPRLNLSGLTKSQNLDFNVAVDNAISYAKKVQKNPKGVYEIPVIKIHGLTEEQSLELNRKFKGEIINRPPGEGDGMGIVGVTFVIAAGAIIGWSMSERGKDIVVSQSIDPNGVPLDERGLEPYRISAKESITLSYAQTQNLLNSTKIKKGK